MYFQCSFGQIQRLLLSMACSLLGFSGLASADATPTDCHAGRSLGFQFCFDSAVMDLGLPLGPFDYVLVTPDRQGFITFSLIEDTAEGPGLDIAALTAAARDARLPMGNTYAYTTQVEMIDPAADAGHGSYKATLSGPEGFGFTIQTQRVGKIDGGTLRVALMTIGEDTDLAPLTQAFADVSASITFLN